MSYIKDFYKAYDEIKANTSSGGGSATSGGSSNNASPYMNDYKTSLQNLLEKKNSVYDAPIYDSVRARMTVGDKKKKEEEKTWFKEGSDSIVKTILGSGADLVEDITAGILGIGEKAVDAFAMLTPAFANANLHMDGFTTPEVEKAYKDLQSEAQKEIDAFVSKDLYDETAIAKEIISGVGSASYLDGKVQSGYVTEEDLKLAEELKAPVRKYMEEDMEKDSVLGEKADSLVQSAGQLAGQYGLSMVGVPWFVTSGVTSFGSESENALKEGATHEEAVGSGAVSAAAEILSEKLFGGDLFVKKGSLDLATKHLAANVTNKAWRTFLKWGGDSLGEGVEEVFSEFVSKLGSSLYREENLGEILFSEQAIQDYIDSFAGGVGLGGVMGGINVAQSKAAGVDFGSGLTVNEEKVVQKELEKRIAENDGKVTAKQKADIYEEVVRDMENGRIPTDDTEVPLVEEIKTEEAPPEVIVTENSTAYETENIVPAMPISTAEQEVSATIEPKTTADKAQEHYRGDILNRGDILSKLVNSGKTTMESVNESTKQAQTLISKGADGVKSIGEIFGRISTDGKLDKFEDYLHHMLNVDRLTLKDRVGRDGVPLWGYSAEESQKRADKLAEENPEFVKAAEDVYTFMDYVMRVRVQSGKITQEQADRWKVDYPHYVPVSRGGNADAYTTLLKFSEGDTSEIATLDDFAREADLAADVYKAKATSHNVDSLMDTMVNAAFTAHWGLAISDNGVTAPVQTQTTVDSPVVETATENQTVDDYVPSAEKAPSPDAVQPADHESIKLMEQHDGVRGKLDDAVHWAEDNILDNGRVFEKIDHKKGNRNLYSHWHAIRNAFSSAQHFIGKGNSAKGVRALNDIYAEINKKGLTSDFDSYLAHQRNIDGMTMQARYGVAANREVIKGVSAAQSYREVRKLETEHPEFKQWAKDIYANTGYVIDQMVEHKMLSQDMADLFKELYPHYVPVRYGKNGALESSLESMGQFTVEAFNSFAMNDFGLELKHTLRSEINREDMNIDTFIDRLDSGVSLFDFDVNGMDEDYHTFTVYEDGELKTFDITREMYMAMNQTRNWMDWKIPVLYQVNEGFRKATTELNWIFAATNGIKDPQEIMWNSQHPLETYAKFLPAEAAVWSKDSKYRHYYEEYLANGGESVEYFNPNNNKFDADKGVLSYLNQKIGTGAISNLNGRVETAPRLAEYIASREAGKSVQESMLDAAQVTVNFQAGGKLTKFLNRNGCTFLNASVQGALQHVRNIQEGKQNAWKGVSALIAKGMVAGLGSELVKQINHLLWDDDDEYEKLPDYVKDGYYLFGKFGDSTWLRLPKGRTNEAVEEAIKQAALHSMGDDEADWNKFWDVFIENMAPNNPLTNNIFAPIIEVATNTSWYGEDIVPNRLKDLPASDQFDEKTDDLSVWLGEQLDYSPKKINYLLNSYTGVVGDTFLPMMTPKAESPDDTLLGKLVAPIKDKFTTDAILNHRATEDFYEALEAAELKAQSDGATLEDKLESGLLIGYNVELSDLYEKQREIQMDKSLTNSEKYEKTREIKKEINAKQEEALKTLDGYEVDGIYAEAGDKRYNFDEENDTWWEVKPKTADGEDNWYYQQEQLYHDYLGVDYADYWNGRLNPKDYKVKSLYAEENGKRYNFDMKENAWYEIKPKNKDGSDNYYYQQEQRITKDLGISPERYWNNRQMFDDFYYIAGGYEKDSPEDDTIETARAVFGYEEFAKYASELKNIKADRDENGEIIKNSKYPKVKAYIDSLDISDIEKKILYTMQYPNYKKYKGEIVKYLDQNDDISYYSFYKILEELDYKVDKNGRVTWY